MALSASVELPLCPICCEWLGKYGGPVTLPCGHNGCLDCFSHVKSWTAECPLCRKAFDPALQLSCNHEMRDLIARATAAMMDDETRSEGWEAFPTAKVTNEHYALTMQSEQQQHHHQHHHHQQQQQQSPLNFQSCYGPQQQQQQQQQQQSRRGTAYPIVPLPAVPPTTVDFTSGSSGGGGGSGSSGSSSQRPGVNPGVIAGTALMQDSGQGSGLGLGALVSSSSSSRVGAQQYHSLYHQHPGLPTSAPSGTQSDILLWEPPQWLPDSYAPSCCGCHQPFKPLTRLRHHCRLCGKVFCNACSSQRKMLPPRFRQREPQRVCDMCDQLLEPLQAFLIGATAACVQPPVHDALDAVSLRSWLNNPWGSCMADEVYKAANILHAFSQALRPELERQLPTSLLRGVRGLALLSVMRVGAGWSCTAGTGLVVTRQRNGAWSAPCAISCYGVGWGLSLGGQLTDVLLVLRTDEAVRAFAAGRTLGLGGAASLALGPVGRSAEASLRVGGLAAKGSVLGYSCSKGAYAGVGLEGTVTSCRDAINRAFYGYSVTPRQLLVDCSIPQPPAAALLYDRLDCLTALWENRGLLVHTHAAAAAGAAVHAAAAAAAGCGASGVKSTEGGKLQEGVPAAAAAAAGGGCGMLGSSIDSSSSREWDIVGAYSADAIEQFDDLPHHHHYHQQQQPPSQGIYQQLHHHQQQQQQGGGAGGLGGRSDEEDALLDDVSDFLASAPPAPTHLLHDYQPAAPSSQQQQGSGVQQQAEEEDEETMYALEW